jgi:predicted dehydrogenase
MGELKIEGIYPLAYVKMLTGVDVRRVFARTAAHFHQANVDNDVEDLATVSLEMEGDVVGSLCIGRIGAASHPDIGEIKIHMLGGAGALVFSEARPEVSIYYRGQPATEFRNRRIGIDIDFLIMDDFARAIDTGGPTILDAAASRAITATVDAAVQSGKTGQAVDVSRP